MDTPASGSAHRTPSVETAMPLLPPTLHDVYAARRIIAGYLTPTPLLHSPVLSAQLNCDVYLKCEQFNPTGAFKVRGGLTLVSRLSAQEKQRGLITASTGNHGQSIAYAARIFGVPAIIGAPVGSNPDKVTAMRALGAQVVLQGKDYDEARAWVEATAAAEGYRYVHSGNEPLLIAGVGTVSLEILEALPDVDVIIVPVGGGSGASGTCLVTKTINPAIQVIGVQSANAPAAYRSWKARAMVEMPSANTFADGLATRVPFELPQRILWEHLHDFILVSDEELRQAIIRVLESAHLVVEGAGAASTAAAFRLRERLAGKKVALILSGGNITLAKLRAALVDPTPW